MPKITIERFATLVFRLCLLHGGSVTSWIRSAQRNADFGGVTRSAHLVGLGVDIVLDSISEKDKMIIEARRLNLFALDEGDHVHISVPREAR